MPLDSLGDADHAEPEQGAFQISVIFDVDVADEDLAHKIEEVKCALADHNAELMVTCPSGLSVRLVDVEVLAIASTNRSYRWDTAANYANGELLAFIDGSSNIGTEWINSVFAIFDDPRIALVGGPVQLQAYDKYERLGRTIFSRCLGGVKGDGKTPIDPKRLSKIGNGSNFVVRADVFREVGGFQSPAEGEGPWLRLSHKVRVIQGAKVGWDANLASHARAPRFLGDLVGATANLGRERGFLARRYPGGKLFVQSMLASFGALIGIVLLLSLLAFGSGIERIAVLVLVFVASLMGLLAIKLLSDIKDGVSSTYLVGLFYPFVLLVFGFWYLRGFFGSDMGQISPPRKRNRPLRILILNWRDVTHPWSGGAENYMHEIAKHWIDYGFEVGWLTQRHSKSSRHDVIDGIRIHRVGGRLSLYARAAVYCIFRLRGQYDVVVDCENGIPFFSPLYTRLPTILLVHHVHQEIFRRQLPEPLRWIASSLEGKLMPWVYKKCRVVAVSEETKSDLVDLGFEQNSVEVIKNGVHRPGQNDTPKNQVPTVFCMGRLKPQKSVDVLVRSVPYLVESLGSVQVDIIGQGPDLNRLEELAWTLGVAKFIRFHGYVSSEIRDNLAASAWVAACPSAFEGWGVVCMEASARGLPVVASNVAGLRESVRHNETGLLFDYGDEKALAGNIVELVQNEGLRTKMALAGLKWASLHTWEASAHEFAILLQKVVGTRRFIGSLDTGKIVAINPSQPIGGHRETKANVKGGRARDMA